jgi:hypothetical protein
MGDMRLKPHCKEHGLAKDEAIYSTHPLVYQRDNKSDDSARCRLSYMIIAQGAGLYAEVTAFVELGYWFPVSTTIGALFES